MGALSEFLFRLRDSGKEALTVDFDSGVAPEYNLESVGGVILVRLKGDGSHHFGRCFGCCVDERDLVRPECGACVDSSGPIQECEAILYIVAFFSSLFFSSLLFLSSSLSPSLSREPCTKAIGPIDAKAYRTGHASLFSLFSSSCVTVQGFCPRVVACLAFITRERCHPPKEKRETKIDEASREHKQKVGSTSEGVSICSWS